MIPPPILQPKTSPASALRHRAPRPLFPQECQTVHRAHARETEHTEDAEPPRRALCVFVGELHGCCDQRDRPRGKVDERVDEVVAELALQDGALGFESALGGFFGGASVLIVRFRFARIVFVRVDGRK